MVWNRKHIQIKTDKEWYYWLGFFLGDGYKYLNPKKNKGSVCFYLSLNDDYVRLYDYFTSLGINVQLTCPISPRKKYMIMASIQSMSLAKAFDLYYPGKQIATTKRIPAKVWSASLDLRNSFLQGVLDSDGYIPKTRSIGVSIHLANCELIKELYLLAHSSGIPSNIVKTSDNSWRLNLHNYYVYKYLHRGLPSKNRLSSYCKPSPVWLLKQCVLDLYEVIPPKEEQDRALILKVKNGGNISIYTIKHLYEKYKIELPGPIYDYEVIGELEVSQTKEETYTLSVDSELHRFEADTVINKNTSADITKLALALIYERLYAKGYSPLQSSDIKPLLQVHDEVILEATLDKGQEALELEQTAMLDAGYAVLTQCPIVAEGKLMRHLGEKD